MCEPITAGSRTFAKTDIEIKNRQNTKILFIME